MKVISVEFNYEGPGQDLKGEIEIPRGRLSDLLDLSVPRPEEEEVEEEVPSEPEPEHEPEYPEPVINTIAEHTDKEPHSIVDFLSQYKDGGELSINQIKEEFGKSGSDFASLVLDSLSELSDWLDKDISWDTRELVFKFK